MLPIEPRKILMCVSPGEDFDAALDYVVTEAGRRDCGIHLVLAVRDVWAGPPDVADLRLVDGEWRKYGTDFLIDCESAVTRAVGRNTVVSTEITHGAVVPALVDVSQNAALVVLQHHRMDRGRHVPTLSVTSGVAARAHAPVVAVPDSWRETAHRRDVVVAGVEDATGSAPVVRWAFEEARRLGAGVRMVCGWFLSDAFDSAVFEGQAGVTRSAYVREHLHQEVAELVAEFPDVDSEVMAVHGRAADVLVAQSHDVRRLVVGRHEARLPLGSHLGPVTRAVLSHSACPVVVVDTRPTPPAPRSSSGAESMAESTR